MKKFYIIGLLLLTGSAAADVDTIRVGDTTVISQLWSNYNAIGFQKDTFQVTAFQQSTGAGNSKKVASLLDRISGTAIFEQTLSDSQRFTLENTAISVTADSLIFEVTARRTGTGTTTLRQRLGTSTDATFSCDGADHTLTTTYTLFRQKFTGTASGAGACANALTATLLNSSEIEFRAQAIAASDTILVGQFDALIYFTPVDGAPVPKRRRRLQIISAQEEINGANEFAKIGYFNPDEITGFAESRWLWSEK